MSRCSSLNAAVYLQLRVVFVFRTPKREMTSSTLSMRMDRTIIEGLHDIVSVLEDHLKPLVQVRNLIGDPKICLLRIRHTQQLLFKTRAST
jgi:hypothetical protein